MLGGQRHRGTFVAAASDQGLYPEAEAVVLVFDGGEDGTGAVDQERAQVGIAFFGDAAEPDPAAGGVLFGRQAQPGGELTGVAKLPGVTDAGEHRGGGDRADAGDGHEPLRRGALAGKLIEFAVVGEHLLVQGPKPQVGVMQQSPGQRGQAVFGIFKEVGDMVLGRVASFGHDQAEFREQAAQAIGQGGCWARNGRSLARLKVLRKTTFPRPSTPCRLKLFFARSNPIVVTFMTTPPVPLIALHHSQSGTFDTVGAGGVHIIRYVSDH